MLLVLIFNQQIVVMYNINENIGIVIKKSFQRYRIFLIPVKV